MTPDGATAGTAPTVTGLDATTTEPKIITPNEARGTPVPGSGPSASAEVSRKFLGTRSTTAFGTVARSGCSHLSRRQTRHQRNDAQSNFPLWIHNTLFLRTVPARHKVQFGRMGRQGFFSGQDQPERGLRLGV
jgi:hypothetical protein